jgi:predicted DNA-binding transcriptional regulator YafY
LKEICEEVNRNFLRKSLLVRTILENNGVLNKQQIIEKILRKFEAYQDIQSLRYDDYPDRTFENDKKSIKDAWKIDLECHQSLYSINTDFEGVFQNDLLNSAIFLSSLNTDMLLPGFVIPETRKNTGLDYFHVISQAIESNKKLKILYFDYLSQRENHKTILPYRLKQKDFKWYVLAEDEASEDVLFKSFALERIRQIEISETFKPKNIDFQTPYQDAIGMFTNENAEEIIVEFDHRDGHYLKANPIHSSQKIISETPETIRLGFFVKPNEDFQMELLKRSWSLKVIKPISLKEKMMAFWKLALERNEFS